LLPRVDATSNRLALASVEELKSALQGFDGALNAISHNQAILRAIGIEREIALWKVRIERRACRAHRRPRCRILNDMSEMASWLRYRASIDLTGRSRSRSIRGMQC